MCPWQGLAGAVAVTVAVSRLHLTGSRGVLLRRSSGGSPRRVMLQPTSQADVSVVDRTFAFSTAPIGHSTGLAHGYGANY